MSDDARPGADRRRSPADDSTDPAGTDDSSGSPDPVDHPAIDWDEFWREADEARRNAAATGQYGKADLIERFFEAVGTPEDLGSFGCGPAHAEFAVADLFPDVDVYGYDVARSVIAENRASGADRGIENVSFAVDRLPDLATDRSFDLVYCVGTLYYVPAIERAVEALYERVRPGGHLVVDYPNRLTPAAYRRVIADADDPEEEAWYRDRFSVVLDRENLLSYDRIHELLGRWPRSYYSLVDAQSASARAAPCVYVPK